MLAYNSILLRALEISREAKRWFESGLISADQYHALKAAHTTPLYTPNIFIRLSLGIFSAIGLVGFSAVFGLLFNWNHGLEVGTGILVMGVACVVLLEYLIRDRHPV